MTHDIFPTLNHPENPIESGPEAEYGPPPRDPHKKASLEAYAKGYIDAFNADREQQPAAQARELVDALHTTLVYDTGADTETLLAHQARSIDAAFRRLMTDADKLFASGRCECVPPMYVAALRAQEQYRRTVTALAALEAKKQKRRKTAKKKNENSALRIKARRKPNPRIKQTEGFSNAPNPVCHPERSEGSL